MSHCMTISMTIIVPYKLVQTVDTYGFKSIIGIVKNFLNEHIDIGLDLKIT